MVILPFWDEAMAFDTVPLWAVESISGCRVAKIPDNILANSPKTLSIGCAVCSRMNMRIDSDSSFVDEMVIPRVVMERIKVCWGDENGISTFCGFVWRGKCPQCGTEHAAFRNSTPAERSNLLEVCADNAPYPWREKTSVIPRGD